ncbi:MAG: hypothetical protein IKF82_02475 [Bacilli bacterium]|nr:hypothetical protein [Bacilli bacterium]
MKKKQPVRLAKKEEKVIDINKDILTFILIAIIMIAFFVLIMAFMGPCTESGMWFNAPHA